MDEVELGSLQSYRESLAVDCVTVFEDRDPGFLNEPTPLLIVYHDTWSEKTLFIHESRKRLNGERLEGPSDLALIKSQRGIVPFKTQVPNDFEILGLLVDIDDLIDPDADIDV